MTPNGSQDRLLRIWDIIRASFWEAFGSPGGVWEVIWELSGGFWEVFGCILEIVFARTIVTSNFS